MKAKKTRHLLEESLRQLLGAGNHLRTKEIVFNHEMAALRELSEFERLAFMGQAIEWAVNTKHDFIYVGDKDNPFGYDNTFMSKHDLDRLLEQYMELIKDGLEQMEDEDDIPRES